MVMNDTKTDLGIYMPVFINGGVERVISNLISAFIAQGMKVDLVLNQGGQSSILKRLPPEV